MCVRQVKFFHIYTVFLFGFSHLFYIVFFRQNQVPSFSMSRVSGTELE